MVHKDRKKPSKHTQTQTTLAHTFHTAAEAPQRSSVLTCLVSPSNCCHSSVCFSVCLYFMYFVFLSFSYDSVTVQLWTTVVQKKKKKRATQTVKNSKQKDEETDTHEHTLSEIFDPVLRSTQKLSALKPAGLLNWYHIVRQHFIFLCVWNNKISLKCVNIMLNKNN